MSYFKECVQLFLFDNQDEGVAITWADKDGEQKQIPVTGELLQQIRNILRMHASVTIKELTEQDIKL